MEIQEPLEKTWFGIPQTKLYIHVILGMLEEKFVAAQN